jgi:hypothetical protein
MSNSIFKDKYFRNFLLAIIIFIIVCSFISIRIDAKSFVVNILSGLVGSGITLLVGFLLVDRLTEYLREKQWNKVRKLTLGTIVHHYHEIISWIRSYLRIWEGLENPNFAISRTTTPNLTTLKYSTQLIQNLINLTRQNEPLTSSKKGSIHDLRAIINFYKWIEWRLEHIERVLVPRMMECSTDQVLINSLIELENSIHRFRNSIKYCEFDVCDNEVRPSLIDFLKTFCELYKIIYERYSEYPNKTNPYISEK